MTAEDDFTTTKPLTEATLLKKLVELTRLVGTIPKDKENAFHKYKYLSEAAVKTKLQPLLVQLGLVAVPQYKLLSNVGELAIVECTLTIFDSESGAALFPEPKAVGAGSDKADKGPMKAMTAALKYAWTSLLSIPTGEDPEADTATDKPEIQRPRALAAPAPREPIFPEPVPPARPQVEKPYGSENWKTKMIQVANIERKSTNPKAPYHVSVLDDDRPWKLFGEAAARRVEDLMKTGEPFEVKYSTRTDKWETDGRVIEEVVHVDEPF